MTLIFATALVFGASAVAAAAEGPTEGPSAGSSRDFGVADR
jgi:hypothetical protein